MPFNKTLLSLVRKSLPQMIASELVEVQPMLHTYVEIEEYNHQIDILRSRGQTGVKQNPDLYFGQTFLSLDDNIDKSLMDDDMATSQA